MEAGNLQTINDWLFPLSIFRQKLSGTGVAGLLETTNEEGKEKRDSN